MGRPYSVTTCSLEPMVPVTNPVIRWNVRPALYSSMSSSRLLATCGVIHPAHGLSLGKPERSRTATSSPARVRARAQVEPAGPPPTMITSQCSITGPGESLARPGNRVAGGAREDDLEELHGARGKRRLRSGEVQAPS